ncbi:MAG: TolC family protein [Methylocystis sp.]|uniref:TolC family protein n=1 Tax=Methylocystis sp. TaxID=1911079 RepID=UPI003DA4D2E6
MSRRAPLLVIAVCALAAPAFAGPKASGEVTVKGDRPAERRGKKTPLGHVLMRHLDMAVAIDAQSRGLAAQGGAISSRYATTRSVTPGSPFVGGTQRNAVAGNLRDYNETELEAGMPLWLPGQRDAMEATVTTGVAEIDERLAQRRLEVAGLLRDAWWNAQRAAREAGVARSRVATAREIGADMTRRVELGDAAQADALLAKNELLAAETELAQAEGAEKVARVTYEALTGGAPPDGTLESAKPAGDIEDHPALRTPIAALRRAEAHARLVEATPIDNPEVGVFGRKEHNRQYSTDPSQQITDQLTNATTVGVRFRIPLPTPGRNEPRQAEALAEMTRAQADYEKAVRMVLAEIQAARVNLAAAKRAAGIADQRLAVANEQFALTRKSFALGEIGALDFYRVRQLQLDAQRSQAAAAVAVGAAVSRLNQAQGYAP